MALFGPTSSTTVVRSGSAEAVRWIARGAVAGDVDEHAANLSGWRQAYDQLGTGRFTGHLDEVLCEGVQIFRERTSQLLRQRCEVWPDAIWVGITEADDGTRLNGRRADPQSIMMSGTGGAFELVSPAGHAIIGFVASRALLARHLPDLDASFAEDASCWTVHPGRRQAALSHARAALVLAASAPAEVLRQSLLEALADLLAARVPVPVERGNATSRRRLVARVHARVAANPDAAPTVAELCSELHVSRRALQYAFEEEVGVSPLAYLRGVRLNGVRRMLRRAAPGLTVQEAATAWGFWNLSAFSADYRRLFGERASETLLRARHEAGRH